MITALVIDPDGSSEYREVPTGYPAFNNAVLDGGYMQELRCADSEGTEIVFIMDEEGKYKGLQPNYPATNLWYHMGGAQLMPGDIFSGVVAVCGATAENIADVPQSVRTLVERQEPRE